MANLPRIAVIGTGGTISSLGASSMDVLDYRAPARLPHDLRSWQAGGRANRRRSGINCQDAAPGLFSSDQVMG